MKSSTGQYYIGLDHVRAVAAFMVFTWHFIHVNGGNYAGPPLFPLSVLTEGHTGVALFMVLSGYLFAKLLDGKKIVYSRFIWNRFLRLAPLLLLVVLIVGVQTYFSGQGLGPYIKSVLAGVAKPSLPNGGWSITAEFHFYMLLPFLLFLATKWRPSLILVLVIAVVARVVLWKQLGQVQTLAYWTIVGRIDQFVLGILAFTLRHYVTRKHAAALLVLLAFLCFYWWFDAAGGFYKNPSYPSPSAIWIYFPAVEGLAYGVLIPWYDNSFEHSEGAVSRFVAVIGKCSYSIYLLHVFFVFDMSQLVNDYVVELSNIHLAILFAAICFLPMIPLGLLGYHLVELPFLRFRKRYIVTDRHEAGRADVTGGGN